MPKFPKGFGRRKSTANAFEDIQDTPVAEPSFKVFERPDGGSKSFDGGVKLTKVATGGFPVGRPKTSHREENMFEGIINGNRGSGASNTNTASTTDNSSRLSAASTAPSSTDTSRGEDWKTSHEKSFNDIPVPPIPKSQSGFSLKAAGRSLSWGRNSNKNPIPATPLVSKELPSPPTEDEYQPRQRAVTSSSYASTATPPKLDERDLGLSLGGDFADMFSGFGKRKSQVLEVANNRAMSESPDISPAGPARSYAVNRPNQLSPLTVDKNKDIEAPPYSWSSQHSHDGLMSSSTPPPFAPRNDDPAPPLPQHGSPFQTNDSSPNFSRQQRPGVLADTGLRRNSGYSGRRKSTIDYGEAIDEDARLLRESVNASRRLNDPSYVPKVRDSWALPSDKSYKVDEAAIASWTRGSVETTPRAKKAEPSTHEDSMFDNHIAEAAVIAQRFQETPISPPMKHEPQNKVMTPAQFERYRQDQERMRSLGGESRDEGDDEDETYDDEEDEAEKNKQLAKQRRKQEAHMAVYRQQMMKVTGEAASLIGGSPRPQPFASQSSPNLNFGQPEEGEEEDEEVPLAILQAHGFPNKNKPPMQRSGSNPNLRAPSVAGGPLPVFARNLPQDPYFGAGIVHPSNRESLAFGGGAGSVIGVPPRGLPPGGLVGVIATEERSRAMRRGSPNPQGEYGPLPSNGFNGMGMPPNGGSMMNGMGGMGGIPPMGPMGLMNPMMLTPGDQAQMQMSQQMQQFMQMQMQFMQMMTQGQSPPPPNAHMPQQFGDFQRPHSAHGTPGPSLRPGSSHQRAMSSLDPNSAPWMQGGMFASSPTPGYAPSIAPSERSNIGLPGRYRPVSHAPPADDKSRASTMMSGALQSWENKHGQATVKTVRKSENVSDEDDEEGWEEMKKKREKKKSIWRTKKDTNGLREMLGYTQ